MDIHWRDTSVCPTEDQYKEMVQRKTGGLFGLAVRLMQVHSASTEDFKRVLYVYDVLSYIYIYIYIILFSKKSAAALSLCAVGILPHQV